MRGGLDSGSHFLLHSGVLSMLNLKSDFGAVGDGAADDAPAFSAAQISGELVYVPPGTYRHVGHLDIYQGGFVGAGQNASGLKSRIIFYECLDANGGAIVTSEATHKGGFPVLENLHLTASSWDPSTGCLGHGFDLGMPIILRNITVGLFKRCGLYPHANSTFSNAPYGSLIENVLSAGNGEHGCRVDPTANNITFINYMGKWNGVTSFGGYPSAGEYDGFYVNGPNTLTVVGGDCSYNSRWGWNFASATRSFLAPSQAENNYRGTVMAVSSVTQNPSGGIRVGSTGHGLSSGQGVHVFEVGGCTEANGYWKVSIVDANYFDLDGSKFKNSYTSGGRFQLPSQLRLGPGLNSSTVNAQNMSGASGMSAVGFDMTLPSHCDITIHGERLYDGMNDTTQALSGEYLPEIQFGGNSAGVTYATRVGRFEKIGGRTFCNVSLVLSSKGSSTGTVSVTLPRKTKALGGYSQPSCINIFGLTGVSGGIQGYAAQNSEQAYLFQIVNGSPVVLNDANFTNNSQIQMTFVYE